MTNVQTGIVFLQSETVATNFVSLLIFVRLLFKGSYYSRAVLMSRSHQQRLDMACTSSKPTHFYQPLELTVIELILCLVHMQQMFGTDNHYIQDEGRGHEIP